MCFEEVKENTVHDLIRDNYICSRCLKRLMPRWLSFEILGIKGSAIFQEGEEIKNLLYQFENGGDFELKDIFFGPFKNEIRLLFRDWKIILLSDERKVCVYRRFNPIKEMTGCLNLHRCGVVYYKKSFDIYGNELFDYSLKLKNNENVENSKVLIIGSSVSCGENLKKIINEVKKLNPKKIKMLFLTLVSE